MANQNQSSDDKKDVESTLLSNQSQGSTEQDKKVQDILSKQIKRNFRKPPDPRPNPLSKFTSYTYQLTLYMITPDAYNAFVDSGRKNINALSARTTNDTSGSTTSGAFIVAQSGGVNDKNSQRPPGMKLDYYIDDLKITSAISGKTTSTSSFTTDISFSIYEPYGFSFVSEIARASAEIKKTSEKFKNLKNVVNNFRQFFILGIRFQGYDENGNPATADTTFNQASRRVDPRSGGVFEVFYDIVITELKYKLGGGGTVYNLKGNNVPTKVGLGTKLTTIVPTYTITASNVREALQGGSNGISGLMDLLNNNERLVNKDKPNKFSVEFWNEDGEIAPDGEIGSAKLRSPADLEKIKTAMANFTYSTKVSEAEAVKATVNNNNQIINVGNGDTILQAIQKIISLSQYLEKALQVVYTTAEEPDPKTDQPSQLVKNDPPFVKWYTCSPVVKIIDFDPVRQDWVYDIKYIIQPYETPATFSAFTKSSQYYGPVKRYSYWFTGKNSEVLSYEQTLNNNYFLTALTGNQTGEGTGTGVPLVNGRAANASTQGKQNRVGMAAQNAYITNLFDPESILSSKIKILGDPDFLIPGVPENINEVYNQFYRGGGFTINANGGQVFIEIDFNEAKDYNNDSGTLDVNESIMLWPYPPQIAKYVKGVSFMVLTVTSNFSKGTFTQDLDLSLNQFHNTDQSKTSNQEREKAVNTTAAQGNTNAAPNVRAAPTPANISKQVFDRTGVSPSDVQGGRGNVIPPAARPNNNDDNQGSTGKTQPGLGNISDNPMA